MPHLRNTSTVTQRGFRKHKVNYDRGDLSVSLKPTSPLTLIDLDIWNVCSVTENATSSDHMMCLDTKISVAHNNLLC